MTAANPTPPTAGEARPGRVAFIGLGTMGLPMALNLVRAGFQVAGYNRSPQKTERFAAQGGIAADSVAAAVKDAQVVITIVPDSPDVEAVLLGEDGVFAHAAPGALVIDMSTVRPETARAVATEGAARGFRVLDAPVSGGEPGAVAGTLSIMVGGAEADVEAARPVLEAMGSTVVRVGPSGAGQTVKAANQLIVAGNIQLVAEALVFLEAHGVDTERAFTVLGGGMAGSTVLERKSASMRERRFEASFRAELHHKDLGIVTAE
ncbi:NAD(P)-dependent oxidoreductase [Marinitenerispora sediminis]|uniref:NAD(P)-dependent oxidoreductase n=1 Tax=Marinitenerispora sediminis TaxID=1931232 RepID=UPI000DF304E9|nr:NAD(P)-dependent oxidoreductase [Marinitenerispora sediminis]RCV56075.1 2-hydroxy-3-oxopropionate reductase [Marinitenerispora sediminis]